MKNPHRRYKGRPNLGPTHVREGVALVHRGRSYDGAGLDSNQLAKLTVDLLTGQRMMRHWIRTLAVIGILMGMGTVAGPAAHALSGDCLSTEEAHGSLRYWVNNCGTKVNVAWITNEGGPSCQNNSEYNWLTVCSMGVAPHSRVLAYLGDSWTYYSCMYPEYPIQRGDNMYCYDWAELSERERKFHGYDINRASRAKNAAIERAQESSDGEALFWAEMFLHGMRTLDDASGGSYDGSGELHMGIEQDDMNNCNVNSSLCDSGSSSWGATQ